MTASSPYHADIFSHLPALLMHELDDPAVTVVVDELLAAGWLPGQLRHRVGAEPAQGSVEQDAAHLLALLRGLSRRRQQPEPRTRPACSLCDGEGAFSVTDDVHLCRRCVDILASGQARLTQTG